MTIRLVRPVKKGEQLFISYGPTYGTMPNPQRRLSLQSQYGFL